MFRQTYQLGLLSILSSQGSKPFETWLCKVSNGYIKRITDEDINSLVLELISSNVRWDILILVEQFTNKVFRSSTYVTCPCCPYDSLGIKMQYLNLYIKNLRRYFVMEIEVWLDGIRCVFTRYSIFRCLIVKKCIVVSKYRLLQRKQRSAHSVHIHH